MSQENVEVIRRGVAAWNAGDMAAVRETYDPHVVMFHLEGWPEPGPSVGRDAVMRQWQGQREGWNLDQIELVGDCVDVGDRVIARYRWLGAGHGPDMRMEFTAVYTIRHGKILVNEWFWNHAEALEAVGLSE
jgi:ketosteroid isomerase-like protein